MNTIINVKDTEKVYDLAKGCYQYQLLMGDERWSGAGLKGKAKQWSLRYRRSRDALVQRLRDNGYEVNFVLLKRHKRGHYELSDNGRITCIIGKLPRHKWARELVAKENVEDVLE